MSYIAWWWFSTKAETWEIKSYKHSCDWWVLFPHYYSHITTGCHMKRTTIPISQQDVTWKELLFPYHNRMSHEKYCYSHITTGCHMKRTAIPISQQDVTWKVLLFPYHSRMSHEKNCYSHITTRCHMKRTLYGYWSCKSLHNCQYSVFPKILDSHSVPLDIFQMQVEQNPQIFRENEGKIDPILYLVGIVRCHTVLIWETVLCALILCYFRSLCSVLCNTGWSKMPSRNWWGCHLDILQKLDVRKPMNATDALELLLCLTRRDHRCSVFFNVWEIKQCLDITVLCYVINNTKWWTLFQTQLYSMHCCF